MSISIFDLFSIGIGPSSSHTVGPMRAANLFIDELTDKQLLTQVQHIDVHLYGSLALTGKGHGTDSAVIMGLEGEKPETIDPETIASRIKAIELQQHLMLNGNQQINFSSARNLHFHYHDSLPQHANGMRFVAYSKAEEIYRHSYYSIGGGFVLDDQDFANDSIDQAPEVIQPYPFTSAAQLLEHCQQQNKTIAEIMTDNERIWRSEAQIKEQLLNIWQVMDQSITNGSNRPGILPGGLKVRRRANSQLLKLTDSATPLSIRQDPMNWVNLYALAVNEENASGSKIVTAPTNGAAGIIPAVLKFYTRFDSNPTEEGLLNFLLTAGAIGILFKMGASISAAEVGCQGEVGVAASMAAAGLCAAWGGTVQQVENAAEIGMEHHLGLTCDPINGLVQIPCIERNAIGSTTAINSAKLAFMGDGEHFVSLDQVIKTMRDTGRDMQSKYKETSLGGLAISVDKPAC